MISQVIQIHAEAPAQPRWGEPCNGCGVCCLLRPCPVGIVLSRRWSGACTALRWEETAKRYVCGALGEIQAASDNSNSGRTPAWHERLRRRVTRRLIAAGEGCDCDAEIEPA